MITIKLTPYENTLIGQYVSGLENIVLLDTATTSFSLQLPDAFSLEGTMLTFVVIGTNEAIITPVTGQYINDTTTQTLNQWDKMSICAFAGRNYIVK